MTSHLNRQSFYNKHQPPCDRGFTIIELIVYIAITSVLMAATISFSYQFLDSVSSIQNSGAAEEIGNFILQKALYDFDQSLPVTVPTGPLSLPLTNLAISSSSISFLILNHDFSITPFIENK